MIYKYKREGATQCHHGEKEEISIHIFVADKEVEGGIWIRQKFLPMIKLFFK